MASFPIGKKDVIFHSKLLVYQRILNFERYWGHPMLFLWFSCAFPMVFLWFPQILRSSLQSQQFHDLSPRWEPRLWAKFSPRGSSQGRFEESMICYFRDFVYNCMYKYNYTNIIYIYIHLYNYLSIYIYIYIDR